MTPTISLITASRRPEGFKNLISQLENNIGDYIKEYIAFVNDPKLYDDYLEIKKSNTKVVILNAPEDYIFSRGFDSLYNTLMKKATGDYCLILFDTDTIEVDKKLFEESLKENCDLYSFDMYMQRGDVWEKKLQLYKNDNLLVWFGMVHENQKFNRQPKVGELKGFKVLHNNALDKKSLVLNKTSDGFIILEKTEEGTDSDNRNLLYETLAWKIVNQNERQMNRNWFIRHYEINKEIIDDYAKRANEKYNLNLNIK